MRAEAARALSAVANDNEAPESWLEWRGWRKFVFGVNAHRRWHYTRGAPPVRYIKWYVRSKDAPITETAANLWRSFTAWATGGEPPWVIEAREAAAEAAEERGRHDDDDDEDGAAPRPSHGRHSHPRMSQGEHAPESHKPGVEEHEHDAEAASVSSSVRSAVALSAYKRRVMALGVAATLVCWALFTWRVLPPPFLFATRAR